MTSSPLRRTGAALIAPTLAMLAFSGCGSDAARAGAAGGRPGAATLHEASTPAQAAAMPEGSSTAGTAGARRVVIGDGEAPAVGSTPPALAELAGAAALAEREEAADARGEVRRARVVRAGGKYPLVRVEERWAGRPGGAGARLIERQAMVADHLMVSVQPGTSRQELEAALAGEGLALRDLKPASGVALVSFDGVDLDAMAAAQAKLGTLADVVRGAEQDWLVFALVEPSDPQLSTLWGMNNTGQTGGVADADIDAVEAWDVHTGTHAVLVGVIDTGIDRDHPDLAANMWVNPGESGAGREANGVDDDGNGYIDDWRGWDFANNDNDPHDDHYHGTHCAGTIGAVGDNGAGVAGVCWNVSLVGLKFLSAGGSGAVSDAVEATAYGTLIGCDLTSNSWGGGGYTQALQDAIAAAGEADVLFVAAAGNNGADADASPMYPAAYDNANIISVAATDHADARAYFSNYGLVSVDLGAPGVNVNSTMPNGAYGQLSGTSMACPHVAGACALVRSLSPTLSAAETRAVILGQIDPIASMSGVTVTGGRLNLLQSILVVSGPVIARQSHTADDGGGGDGDGVAEPGEMIQLTITARNAGSEPTTGVVGSIAVDDAAVAIVDGDVGYGDLVPGASTSGDGAFALWVDASAATPRQATITVTWIDGQQRSWSSSFALGIHRTASVAGRVYRIGTGEPIAGASVAFTGPTSGAVTTDGSGGYQFATIDGQYALSATADGLNPGEPVQVVTPPEAIVDLPLGLADIAVSPAAATLVAAVGGSAQADLNLANVGDLAVTFSIAATGSGWEPTALWHASAHRDHDGADGSWYYGREDTRTYDTGDRTMGGVVTPQVTLPSGQPTLSFWSWRQVESSTSYDISLAQLSTDDGATWIQLAQVFDNDATWTQRSVALADWAGQTVRLRFWFDSIDGALNDYEGWYVDHVAIDGGSLVSWLSVTPVAGGIGPGATSAVTLSASAVGLKPGQYHADVVVTSNDVGEPTVVVPVDLIVTDGPLADLVVSPAALALTAPAGGSDQAALNLASVGEAAATFSVAAGGIEWAADGLWHETAYRDHDGAGGSWYYGREDTRTYDTGARTMGGLTSTTLTLSAVQPMLSYWSWRRTESGANFDQCLVQISTDGGTTWHLVEQVLDNDATWVQRDVDLSAWAGQAVRLRFWFDSVDAVANGEEGWYVDQVGIDGGSPTSWLSLTPTSGVIAPGGTSAVTVTASAVDLATGLYHADIIVTSNDPFEPTVVVPVDLIVSEPPAADLVVAPAALALSAPAGGSGQATLDLGNIGAAPATFSIAASGIDWQADGLWHETAYRDRDGAGGSWYYGREDTRRYDTGARTLGGVATTALTLPVQPTLTYWSWRHTETGASYDLSLVQLSTDGGVTWVQVDKVVDTSATWIQRTVDLSTWAGQTVRLCFRFDSVDSGLNNYEGWYIDDVRLNGGALTSAAWLGVAPATGTIAPGGSAAVAVTASAADLEPGSYHADIIVSSNDPLEPTVVVPVDLTVTPVVADLVIAPAAVALAAEVDGAASADVQLRDVGGLPVTFSVATTSGAWQSGGLWHETSHRDHDAGGSWYYGREDTRTYNTGARTMGGVVRPQVIVPAGASTLSFWSWRVAEASTSYDLCLVQVSTDGGATWIQVDKVLDNNATWIQRSVNLAAWAGRTVALRFWFDSVDSALNTYEGWYVDDVRINGAPLASASWLSFTPGSGTIAPGATTTMRVTASAAGLAPGEYHADIAVSSNDLGEPTIIVPVDLTVSEPGPALGEGLAASYFHEIDLTGAALERVDATVDFDWGGGSPDALIGVDTFSARWTGEVMAPIDGAVSFITTSDDGVRLWVGDQLIIDNWADHAPTEDIGVVAMVAGQRYPIRMEFYENGGGAVARLAWQGEGLPRSIVPQQWLFPGAGLGPVAALEPLGAPLGTAAGR
ncbi:MAG TPA: S8 family serine peptidase [Planctomycetota bacterium]|nr:S8 family serine peptidase [Planctomycetota bacterium]